MAMDSLILIANPGSASRKYALFAGGRERGRLHFEYQRESIVATLQKDGKREAVSIAISNFREAISNVRPIFEAHNLIAGTERIDRIALRVVAPSGYFLEDREITDEVLERLQVLERHAPLHIHATLEELHVLKKHFRDIPLIGISDSAFHITKPDYAWNYGLPLDDADHFDIKRFGYHGLSIASAVHTLKGAHKLAPKTVICHIGSGVSITAVQTGRSLDTTMGYSPLEGTVMATRVGTIDVSAVRVLKQALDLDDEALETYLNTRSGLLGLGGSSDVRELLEREAAGDHRAHLALEVFVYGLQKAIGQMVAALGGIDFLGFTATVGERSGPIRQRILERLHYLDLILDEKANEACIEPSELTRISRLAHSKPIFVIPTDEATEMARRAADYSI